MAKGIDQKFVHYGIRRDDLSMIEAICDAENIDFEWLSEDILKAYHAKRVDAIERPDGICAWDGQQIQEDLRHPSDMIKIFR